MDVSKKIALFAVVVMAGLVAAGLAWWWSDGGPQASAGGAVGLVTKGPFPPEPDVVWTTPKGRKIRSGTVDDLGYVLPLDIRRPHPPRLPVEPPAQWEIDALRAAAPASAFAEERLGPDDGHTQNETSIDVSGATLVAGWNQLTDSGGVMGVGRSVDGAESWGWELFDGHSAMADPTVKSGGGGRWYFGYLAVGGVGGSDWEIYVRRSVDDGATWQPPVPVTTNTTFDDKPYLDARGDEVLVGWADFSSNPSRVFAARSLDGGQTFGNHTLLAVASANGNGACPVIAADGTYYMFWRDSFQEFVWMSRSDDQGTSWSLDVPIAELSPLATPQPGGFRMVNLPSAASDPLTGDLVVVWNDRLFGDADILAIRSNDGGDSWSTPVRVNDDLSGEAQFLPWVDVDEDGVFHAVWYDRRHDGFDIDVYYSASVDGGATWEPNVRVTAASFTPILPWEGGVVDFIGDYNAVTAADGSAYPFYQDARSGIQDVYVAVLPTSAIFTDGFEAGNVSAW